MQAAVYVFHKDKELSLTSYRTAVLAFQFENIYFLSHSNGSSFNSGKRRRRNNTRRKKFTDAC